MKRESAFPNYHILVPALISLGLLVGGLLYGFNYAGFGYYTWLLTLAIGLFPSLYKTARNLLQGKFGVDAIAIAAIGASLWAQQYIAGIVILLMLSGGEALEYFAHTRAKRELTKLLNMAPAIAHRKQGGNGIADVSVNEIEAGNTVLVKPGEVVPVDGIISHGISNVDESTITGEPLPQEKRPGSLVYSGSVNQEGALEITAIRASKDSKYETIVRLVREAQETQAPIGRLADRYALLFNAATFAIAAAAWLLFGDPNRVLAVLVVASPCPLILATPIAIMSGISRAATKGIIIKNGVALEKLGQVKALIFDKTGTLTLGSPQVAAVTPVSLLSGRQILTIAASVDQLSSHIFARALVAYAQKKSVPLSYPQNFEEVFGQGVSATLKGKPYLLGRISYLKRHRIAIGKKIQKGLEALQEEGKAIMYVSNRKKLLGHITFSDAIRPETKAAFAQIKKHRIPNIVMLTGDKQSVAEQVARQIGITQYHAELLPEQKETWVKAIQAQYGLAAMVGDGINDAPALASSAVGIAMAGHGATVASETSDIVIMTNSMWRVHDALHIAHRSIAIAKQGIVVGMAVSAVLMVLALQGYIAPIPGAVLQEILDVAIIINALKLNVEKIA